MRFWVLVLSAVLGAGARPAFAQEPEPAQSKKPRPYEIRGYFTAATEKTAKPRWGAYVAAGRTSYELTERSNDERDRASGSGWHVLGGVDVKPHKWIMAAGEAQWTTTEDIFEGGAAEALGESKLGGVRFALRIGFAF